MIYRKYLMALILMFTTLVTAVAYTHDTDPVVGYVEEVRIFLPSDNIVLKAKIDTGAKTSSLDVDELSFFSQKNEDWVRFMLTDNDGKRIKVSLPVERTARIRRAGTERDERPVVKLSLCLGNYYKEVEVNLSDRDGMTYPMLIGRQFLSQSYLVDPSRKFIQKRPRCEKR